MTIQERAYRRGAFQVIHYAIETGLTSDQLCQLRERLKAHRDDHDPKLLGTYLDEIFKKLNFPGKQT